MSKRIILHRGDAVGSTKCGVKRIGLLPYVRWGMTSNFVWDDNRVTCKRCKAAIKKGRSR